MNRTKPGTQTAAERRLAEAGVRTIIARFAPAHSGLIRAARRWLRKRLPTAHEIVYEYRDWFVISFSPNGHGYEGVLGIRASADGVRLFFNGGSHLPDPEKLLRGSGRQTRWIHLERASSFSRPGVSCLIDGAIALNRVPFAETGRGPLVIRPASSR